MMRRKVYYEIGLTSPLILVYRYNYNIILARNVCADLHIIMKGTKVQTLGGRAVAGAWLVAWAIMAMGAIINTHAHR